MGTGLEAGSKRSSSSSMDRKIPTALWRAQRFQAELISSISYLKIKLQEILIAQGAIQQQLNSSKRAAFEAHAINLPLKTINELEEPEEKIKEDHLLYCELASKLDGLGGRSVRLCTFSTMRKLLTNDVAVCLNWKGRNNKVPFEGYTICDILAMLKLVNEAPRASCVECDRSLIPGSSSGSTSPTSDTEFNNNVMSSLSSLILTNGSSSSSSSNNGCAKASHSSTSPHSGLQVGTSTSSTNTMETSNNCWDQLDLSNPFGKAFHGYLSHSQTLQLLTSDGQYLVRKQEDSEDEFVLSVRFNGHVKHFMISCDDATGFLYVGERDKAYHSLQELVQEGLTTLYLDLKAGCYIDLMCDLTNFHNNGSLKNPHAKFNYGQQSRKNSSSPSPSASTASRSSIERRRNLDLKTHSFLIHTFESLSRCQICQNFMWGLSSQGLQCKDCGLSIHTSCVEKAYHECEPRVEFLKEIFGTDLTTLVKAAGGGKPPFVLEKCITEIEQRGIYTEGIYRVSGSRELIERLKSLLEQERESADLSKHIDIHSMCGLVKLYLRLLPQPLITTDVFQKFLTAQGPLTLETIKKNLRRLPLAHQVTLKYLLEHLNRVASKSDKNKMTPFNLSSVFAPSVLCPTLISLNTLKIGTNILETMISHCPQLFPR